MEELLTSKRSTTTMSVLYSYSSAVDYIGSSTSMTTATWDNSSCVDNCSGHGECYNGSCICEASMEYRWSSSLMSAYYPLLLSGSSLIVCFWAEVFHLRDVRWEKPQFLSKSFLAFVMFNVICYSLLLAEFYTIQLLDTTPELKNFYTHIFNGCYAILLLIVLIFFLIYGVEVFFKVRGGFLVDITNDSKHCNENQFDEIQNLFRSSQHGKVIDTSQLHQSRLGLLSQALMLSTIVLFLCGETLGEFWKKKVPLYSRNWHDLVFRVVEIGVALWFPCVLWNCMSPEQLWILNPKRIIKKTEVSNLQNDEIEEKGKMSGEDSCLSQECYICRDLDRTDMGPLIQPCACRGDISVVHHDCLKKWLVEQCCNSNNPLCCSVCNTQYDLELYRKLDWSAGFSCKHWMHTIIIVSCMCISAGGAWLVIQMFLDPGIRTLAASSALLIQYVCVRFLSQKTERAVQRSKAATLKIKGKCGTKVATISDTVSVIIASNSVSSTAETSLNEL
ncbi:uncharacterized protein LOC142334452 isoform X2 [Lycorma delicatula]|uniref:uncharacterized protein LOC142334452 isoform X2 n=1 Tax=Lycorma delicatula TaxID=130591 RepID=UPI003F50DFE8